jgi:hypothetical protein
MIQNILKPTRLSLWRLRDKVELAAWNTYLKPISRSRVNFVNLAVCGTLALFFIFLSLATSFRYETFNMYCFIFTSLALLVVVGILQQHVVFTPRKIVSGSIFWRWLFSDAIAIEYYLIDSVKLTRNFGRPCLEMSSTGAEVQIKLVKGWHVERFIPILKLLDKNGVRWAFDVQCQQLVDRPVSPRVGSFA